MAGKTFVNGSSTRYDGNQSEVTVVLGAQWGDEGKGRMVDFLCQNADVVCRCQGGQNAGHTVVVGDQIHYFYMLPSGMMSENCSNVIGNGVVIHLPDLFAEFKEHEESGLVGLEKRLVISSQAHLVFDFHRHADCQDESGRGRSEIGTTRRGIGPAYSSKASRNGIRVGDLVGDFDVFTEKFQNLANVYLKRYPDLRININEDLAWYREKREIIRPMVHDTVSYLHKVLRSSPGKLVVIEGAQATMLDIDFGSYPMVTSSNSSVGGVCTGLGIPPTVITNIYGVVKAYLTRLGNGCFPTEMDPTLAEHVRTRGSEYAVVGCNHRRCGWLDAVMLQYANMINGFSAFALTKLDILDDQPVIKIGVAYLVNGQKIDYYPTSQEEFTRVEVEYCCLPGWNCSTEHVRQFSDLPANAQAFVMKIEQLVGVHVKWIGVGSERDAIIPCD